MLQTMAVYDLMIEHDSIVYVWEFWRMVSTRMLLAPPPLPPPKVPTQLCLELSQNPSFKYVRSLKPAKSPESLEYVSPKTSLNLNLATAAMNPNSDLKNTGKLHS